MLLYNVADQHCSIYHMFKTMQYMSYWPVLPFQRKNKPIQSFGLGFYDVALWSVYKSNSTKICLVTIDDLYNIICGS